MNKLRDKPPTPPKEWVSSLGFASVKNICALANILIAKFNHFTVRIPFMQLAVEKLHPHKGFKIWPKMLSVHNVYDEDSRACHRSKLNFFACNIAQNFHLKKGGKSYILGHIQWEIITWPHA